VSNSDSACDVGDEVDERVGYRVYNATEDNRVAALRQMKLRMA